MNDNPYESPLLGGKAETPVKGPFGLFLKLGFLLLGGLILIGLLMPAVARRGPETGRRSQCLNNVKQISLAMHNYESAYGSLPPAYTVDENGKPLHSWRALLLPYLEEQELFDQIDFTKPWDDPVNDKAREAVVEVFACPSQHKLADGHTTYMVVVAPDSCFPGCEPRTLKEITDGTSDTLLVVEVCTSQSVHWMSPLDATESMVFRVPPVADGERPIRSPHGGPAFNAAHADGSVRTVFADDLSDASRRALISVNGKDKVEVTR